MQMTTFRTRVIIEFDALDQAARLTLCGRADWPWDSKPRSLFPGAGFLFWQRPILAQPIDALPLGCSRAEPVL